ncbi:MAG TPA: glycosyltransferase family 4 protein [Chitinophagaceae bacterium]
MIKLVRITTVPMSLELLIAGQMKYMQEHGFDVYMISSPQKNTELLEKKEKSKFIAVSMTRTISPVKDLISLVRLIKTLKKIKPHIVHTHTPKAGFLGIMAAWVCRVPVRLHTVAGLPLMEEHGLQRKVLERVEKITYAFATKVYANSKNLSEFIISNKFCSPEKIEVLGNGSSNGIDTEFFKISPEITLSAQKIKEELAIDDKNFVFLFIGRLVKDKGIDELVKAFALLRKKYDHIKLLLVGPFEDELDPLSAKTIHTIKSDKNILQVGFQPEIRPYLALGHALVFPSYREGFPNVPMQAGAAGLPSIVTDINGCNEIIEHEINGLIIPAKDEIALYGAMERLIMDEALYSRLKANARKMIVDRYEQNHLWSLLFHEYQLQLKKSGLVS